jgi:hypothetical protein
MEFEWKGIITMKKETNDMIIKSAEEAFPNFK